MEGGPTVITDLQGAFRLHYTCHRIASVVFDFPAEVSWPNIASLPRNVSSSSKQIPSEVNDFPIPNAFSRHWGGVTPPRYLRAWPCQLSYSKTRDIIARGRRGVGVSNPQPSVISSVKSDSLTFVST